MTAPLTLEQAHRRGYALVAAHSERFLRLVEELDHDELAAPVPGLEWTVAETVAHVRSVYERYTTDPERSTTRRGVAERNARDIARLGLDVPGAVASVREQVSALRPVAEQVRPEQTFPFHAGQAVTLAGGWGNLLGELLAHGDDIARATGRSFPVPGADLEILWRYTAPVLQGWLRAEVATIEETWRLRFGFGDIDVVLDRGRLRWGVDPLPTPDHVVDVPDAAELALRVPYRRRPITDPATALLASRFHDV